VTLRSDYWGQGAHSALPIVGDFFQRAQRSRLIDTRLKFDTQQEPGWFAERTGRLRDWFEHLFTGSAAKTDAKVASRSPARHGTVARPAEPVVPAGPSGPGGTGAAAVEPRALPQPPILPAPGLSTVPANPAVDGEAHGGGEPALAPTPTPDDVVPSEGGNSGATTGAIARSD